jgi:hypothetical protein
MVSSYKSVKSPECSAIYFRLIEIISLVV